LLGKTIVINKTVIVKLIMLRKLKLVRHICDINWAEKSVASRDSDAAVVQR